MSYQSKTYPSPIVSMFFEGRLWFDKSAGNTYHSVRIFINGKLFGSTGSELGYEYAFQYSTVQKLCDRGILPEDVRGIPVWRIANIYGIHIYSSANYVSRKEMFRTDLEEMETGNE